MAYTLEESGDLTPNTSWQYTGYDNPYLYTGGSWTTAKAYTLTQLGAFLYKTNSPTFNVSAQIYGDGSSVPGTLLGSSTNSISASSLTSTAHGLEYLFQFSGVSLSSGVRYWFAIVASTTGGGYVGVGFQSGGSNLMKHSGDGSSWSNVDSAITNSYNTYSTAASGHPAIKRFGGVPYAAINRGVW